MVSCKYCQKEFLKEEALHGHLGLCKKRKIFVDEFLESKKAEIVSLYLSGYSSLHIVTHVLNNIISVTKLIDFLKKIGIKTRTIKETKKLPSVQKKFENTCSQKYGDTNVLGKNSPIYQKRNNSVKEKYGVDNVFQLESVKEKSGDTLFSKYGVRFMAHVPGALKNQRRISKPQKRIFDLLIKNKIQAKLEVNNIFLKYNEILQKSYCPCPDILIEEKKLVVEIYGNYWHGNPNMYFETDIVSKFEGEITVKNIWIFDEIRKKHIESFGYNMIVLWEEEIKECKNEIQLKEFLCKKLKLNLSEN